MSHETSLLNFYLLGTSQPQRNKNANFLLILLKYFVTIFFQLKTCFLNCIYTHHIFYLIGLKYDFWFNPKKIKLNNKILNRSSLFKKNRYSDLTFPFIGEFL